MARANRHAMIRAAFRPALNDMAGRVARGAGVTFLGVGVRVLITIGSTAVLARILTPTDYGYLAMATIVTELAALFGNFGVASILVQRSRLYRIHLDTAFWACVGLGVILTVVVFCSSYAVEIFFRQPKVGQILRALSVMFLFEELAVIQSSTLSRLMQFHKDFIIQTSSLVVRLTTAIALALLGFGVWSLVIGSIAGRVISLVIGWYFVPFVPRLRFHKAFIADNWRTGTSYFGGGLLFYFNTNFDLILIGRRLGPADLGYYQAARSLADEMRNRITGPLQRVLFPAYSSLQNDLPRFRNGVIRSARLLAFVLVPIGFGMAATANELVNILYGKQWLAMIPMLRVIAIAGSVRATFSVVGSVFNATNKVSLGLKIGLVQTTMFFAAIGVGSQWGSVGVAYGVLIGSLFAPVGSSFACRLVGLPGMTIPKVVMPMFIAGLIMLGSLHLIRDALIQAGLDVYRLFAAQVAIGAVLYVTGIRLLSKSSFDDAIRTVREFLPVKRNR